jgi:hypothetical protein
MGGKPPRPQQPRMVNEHSDYPEVRKPSTDQLKRRDRSEGALAAAGRNILSQNGSE